MPHMTTTIGRGLEPVEVHYEADYDYDDEGKEYIDIDVTEVYMYARPAIAGNLYKIDIAGHITESVYQSLESDCKAHEKAEQIRLEAGDSLEPELDAIGGY